MPVPNTSDAILAGFVQRVRQLNTLPAVALRILDLTRNPRVNVEELQQCVESDRALAGKVLRVVNRSLFSLPKPVGDLSQAISMIGIERLKMLVLSFSLPMQATGPLQPDLLQRYWRGALLKSLAARELAEGVWKVPGDEAFVAGLLQDVGLLVLVQDLGDSYGKFLRSVWSAGDDPRALELGVLGFDHVQLTSCLLSDWGFPANLVRGIAAPYDVSELLERPFMQRTLPQILCLAELISRFLINRQDHCFHELLHAGERFVGLTLQQLQEVFVQLDQKAPQLAEDLLLPWTDEAGYLSLPCESYDRQGEALNEMASQPHLLRSPAVSLAKDQRVHTRARSLEHGPSCSSNATARTVTSEVLPQPPEIRLPTNRVASPADAVPRSSTNLVTALSAVVGNCRHSRVPVSLTLIQLDNCEALSLHRRASRIPELIEDIKSFLDHVTDCDRAWIFQLTSSRIGLIQSRLDRQESTRVARQVLDEVRNWSHRDPHCPVQLSVSIGLSSVPLPPRNLPVQEMIEAAERCLHGVQLSGGDGLKSIDIF